MLDELSYELYLETYNSLGSDTRSLVNDTIEINIVDLCKKTQSDFDALAEEVSPLQAASTIGTFGDSLSYYDVWYLMVDQFGLNQEALAHCPEIIVELSDSLEDLSLSNDAWSITILPYEEKTIETELNFAYYGFTLSIPVEIVVVRCIIKELAFEDESTINIEYEIGSGLEKISLPGLSQTPHCTDNLGVDLMIESQESIFTSAEVLSAITLVQLEETQDVQLYVDTASTAFSGEKVKLSVNVFLGPLFEVVENDVAPLNILIQFKELVLDFDSSELKVDALQCSIEDDGWSFKLPPLQYPSIQTVIIEMVEDKDSENFSYN